MPPKGLGRDFSDAVSAMVVADVLYEKSLFLKYFND